VAVETGVFAALFWSALIISSTGRFTALPAGRCIPVTAQDERRHRFVD